MNVAAPLRLSTPVPPVPPPLAVPPAAAVARVVIMLACASSPQDHSCGTLDSLALVPGLSTATVGPDAVGTLE
jgi:hypothetical protein